MEPITIVQIASAAGGIAQSAWKVYEFINHVKNVDTTVRRIQGEMKQVTDMFGLVKEQVKLLDAQDSLLSAIQIQIDTCAIPIRTIEGKLGGGVSKKSNIFKQAFRQLKLDMSESEIEKCRQQIQGCILNLQLSLQLVNLQATYLAPKQADEVLLSSLKKIQKTLDTQNSRIDKNMQRCAEDYISSGNTLYAESIRGGSVIGSVNNTKTSVNDWLNRLGAMKIDEEPPSFRDEEISVAQNSAALTTTDGEIAPTDIDYESDDSLNDEITKSTLSQAKDAFLEERFDFAQTSFQEFLKCLEILPVSKRSKYDLEEVSILLAICVLKLGDTVEAENVLVTVVSRQTKNDKNAELRLAAAMCLANIYMTTKRYDLAISIYENIYRGQKKLLGKNHERCYETLSCLAKICNLQKNLVRAKAYLSMIPEEVRDQYRKVDEKNEPTAGFMTQAATPLPPPFAGQFLSCENTIPGSVAWSSDSKMFARSLRGDPSTIELRNVWTGNVILVIKTYHSEITRALAFDDKTEKIAGLLPWITKVDFCLCIWRTTSGNLIHKVALDGESAYAYPLGLYFAGDVLVCGYSWDKYKCASFRADNLKRLFEAEVPEFSSIFKTKQAIGFTHENPPRHQISLLKYYPKVHSFLENPGQVLAAAESPISGVLYCILRDGTLISYLNGLRMPGTLRTNSELDGSVLKGAIAFTETGKVITLVWLESTRHVWLGAPEGTNFIDVAYYGIHAGLGVSPDAKYAFWIEDKTSTLRTVRVEQLLGLHQQT